MSLGILWAILPFFLLLPMVFPVLWDCFRRRERNHGPRGGQIVSLAPAVIGAFLYALGALLFSPWIASNAGAFDVHVTLLHVVSFFPLVLLVFRDYGLHRERFQEPVGDGIRSLAAAGTGAILYGVTAVLFLVWIVFREVSAGRDMPSILKTWGLFTVGTLALLLFGAAWGRYRTRVCAEGIIRKSLWRKRSVLAWSEIESVDICWDDTGWFDEEEFGKLPKFAPNGELRFRTRTAGAVTLPLGIFPSRRAVVEFVFARVPEGTVVEPRVHEYLDKLKRMA